MGICIDVVQSQIHTVQGRTYTHEIKTWISPEGIDRNWSCLWYICEYMCTCICMQVYVMTMCILCVHLREYVWVYIEALIPDQNPMCDLPGPTLASYKGFIWQLSWGKSSDSTLNWCTTQPVHTDTGGSCSHRLRPIQAGNTAFLVQVPQFWGILMWGECS